MSGKWSQGSLRRQKRWRADSSPMEYVANLADVMLVFACGLMMALIVSGGIQMHWKQVELDQQMTEVDQVDGKLQDLLNSGSSYQEMGTLYRDPETGKMYMLVD